MEADVTVRQGVSFDGGSRDLANGVDGDDEKDARKSGGKRGGGGEGGRRRRIRMFSFLCGSVPAGDDAFDAVNDAFSDGSLLDEYDLGAVLGRGQYGSVRLAYRRRGSEAGAEVRASSVRASSVRASSSGRRSEGLLRGVRLLGESLRGRLFFSSSRVRGEIRGDGRRSVVSRPRASGGGHHARRVRSAPVSPVVHAAYEQKSPSGVRVVHVVTDAYFGGDLVEGVARAAR